MEHTSHFTSDSGIHMAYTSSRSNLGIGSIAFLAGVLATIVTAYAVVSKKQKPSARTYNTYEGWEDSLGV
jgi:hypothetical protein